MKFGLFVNTERKHVTFGEAWSEDIAEIVIADRLGIQEAWVSEHGVTPELLITKASALTDHIRMGPGVRPLPFHHPLQVAIEANATDQLTNGRYMLGLGLGGPQSGPKAMEQRGLDPANQRAMMHESINYIMTAFAADGPFDFDGKFWHGTGVELDPPSIQHPHVPMGISTTGTPSTMELAARLGIYPIFSQFSTPDEIFAAGAILEEAGLKSGRPGARSDIRACNLVYVADSLDQAKADLRESMSESIERQKVHFAHHFASQLPPSGRLEDVNFDYLVDAGHYMIGDPDTVYGALKRYYETTGGIGVFLLLAGKDYGTLAQRERSWTLLMEEVAPRFESAG